MGGSHDWSLSKACCFLDGFPSQGAGFLRVDLLVILEARITRLMADRRRISQDNNVRTHQTCQHLGL